MAGPEPRELVVTAAGHLWALRARSPECLRELSSWFGPWVHEPREGDAPPAGMVTLEDDAPPGAAQGVEVVPGGFRLATEAFDVRVTTSGDAERADVRCVPPARRAAARAALRVLACRRVDGEAGLALHASSVRVSGALVVFAGPSGAGKSSAADAFPEAQRIDSDLVLLSNETGAWARVDVFDEYEPGRFAPGDAAGLRLRAVLVPARGAAFDLRPLDGSDAVRACLHVPAGLDAARVTLAIARTEALARSVPVARMEWALGEDLPALLKKTLGDEALG